jgi:two-component system catabolic regulation response regulator CreB
MQFDGRSAKIMVVDNDRTILEMVQIRLEVAGYHALPVRNAETALEMLTTSRPHAMILERNLPLMDGMGLLEAFAALPGWRPLPVLLVGRTLAAEDVRRGVQLGVRDCLAKPFSGAVVLERLGRMLKKTAPPPGRAVVYV